jgi:hypothetical protein
MKGQPGSVRPFAAAITADDAVSCLINCLNLEATIPGGLAMAFTHGSLDGRLEILARLDRAAELADRFAAMVRTGLANSGVVLGPTIHCKTEEEAYKLEEEAWQKIAESRS